MPAKMMMGQMVQVKVDAREEVETMVVDTCEGYTLDDRIAWLGCTGCLG